jgi:hypothetical protein
VGGLVGRLEDRDVTLRWYLLAADAWKIGVVANFISPLML